MHFRCTTPQVEIRTQTCPEDQRPVSATCPCSAEPCGKRGTSIFPESQQHFLQGLHKAEAQLVSRRVSGFQCPPGAFPSQGSHGTSAGTQARALDSGVKRDRRPTCPSLCKLEWVA